MLSLPYEDKVGLWTHIERIRLQRADAVLQGLCLANARDIGADYCDAVALTEAEAADMHYEINMARAEAMARAKHGMR